MRKLTGRERTLATGTGLIVGAAAVMQLVVFPALELGGDSRARLVAVDTVSAMLDRAPLAQARPAAPLPPLPQRITESAGRAGLDIRRLDPQGGAIAVSLAEAPFASLVGWLEEITSNASVTVLSAEIARRPKPGVVLAQFVLEARR